MLFWKKSGTQYKKDGVHMNVADMARGRYDVLWGRYGLCMWPKWCALWSKWLWPIWSVVDMDAPRPENGHPYSVSVAKPVRAPYISYIHCGVPCSRTRFAIGPD